MYIDNEGSACCSGIQERWLGWFNQEQLLTGCIYMYIYCPTDIISSMSLKNTSVMEQVHVFHSIPDFQCVSLIPDFCPLTRSSIHTSLLMDDMMTTVMENSSKPIPSSAQILMHFKSCCTTMTLKFATPLGHMLKFTSLVGCNLTF